ncbi:hypothetical protein BDV06DRAFT_197627 [Aspergillus oleicola]
MKFTPAILAVLSLTIPAIASHNAAEELGCFSKLDGFNNEGSYTYQSTGYCIDLCDGKDKMYAALKGDKCYCGDTDPAKADMVDDGKCDTPCVGYAGSSCGGDNAWSVFGVNMHTPDSWSTSSAVVMSTTSSTSDGTVTATETHSTTSALINSETSSTTAPSSSTPLSQGATGTPSSTTTSLEYTPTGNSANRAFSFFF